MRVGRLHARSAIGGALLLDIAFPFLLRDEGVDSFAASAVLTNDLVFA